MWEKGLISVIVPVYNVEQYLDTCIRSVLQQSYPLFELLLVDDGSTDSSGALCDRWKKRDGRIRVFHQDNAGLSVARNKGIREAKGEYLCFVDSDDWIHEAYLQVLYENIRAFHGDAACCRYRSFADKGQAPERAWHVENDPYLCSRESLWDTLTDVGADCGSTWLVVSWNKLIRRECFGEWNFPEGKWHEDEFFIHRLLLRINRFVDTPAQLYAYRKRADSICGRKNRGNLRHLDLAAAWKERLGAYESDRRRLNLSAEEKRLLDHKMITAYRMTLRILYGDGGFNRGLPAIWLKLQYAWSYLRYLRW